MRPRPQVSVRASAGDVPVSADSLGSSASTVRNLAWGSFWTQLPLTVVSAFILFFALQFSRAVRGRWSFNIALAAALTDLTP